MAQTHDYGYHLAVPGGYARCRVRVFQVAGQTICLATQQQDKFGGTALSDGAAQLATLAEGWHHPVHDRRFTWVEQYEYPLGNEARGAAETFALVAFERDVAGALCHPTRRPTERAAVEALLGQKLEA